MDLTSGSSFTTLGLDLSNEIKAKVEDVFESKPPIDLPPHMNVDQRIKILPRSNQVAITPYHMSFKKKNEGVHARSEQCKRADSKQILASFSN